MLSIHGDVPLTAAKEVVNDLTKKAQKIKLFTFYPLVVDMGIKIDIFSLNHTFITVIFILVVHGGLFLDYKAIRLFNSYLI